jgi:hypothetical protein
MSDDGLISLASNHPVRKTMDRLEAVLREKDITIFARIDHAAGAAAVDMPLRPTELLIFGSPKAGTPLMQARQSIGIDLPLKMLGGRMRPARSGSPITIPPGSPGGMGWAARRRLPSRAWRRRWRCWPPAP